MRWEASPGTRRISRQICGKDNNTTPPPPKKKARGSGHEADIYANQQEGWKIHTIHNGVAWGCRDSSQTNPGESGSFLLA